MPLRGRWRGRWRRCCGGWGWSWSWLLHGYRRLAVWPQRRLLAGRVDIGTPFAGLSLLFLLFGFGLLGLLGFSGLPLQALLLLDESGLLLGQLLLEPGLLLGHFLFEEPRLFLGHPLLFLRQPFTLRLLGSLLGTLRPELAFPLFLLTKFANLLFLPLELLAQLAFFCLTLCPLLGFALLLFLLTSLFFFLAQSSFAGFLLAELL